MNAELPLDYMSLQKFHELYPNLHVSIGALRWEVNQRRENQLLEERVVIEKLTKKSHTRPKLLISPSRYLVWLGVSQASA